MEYSALIGEIAKAHINYTDIASTLGVTRDTLRNKLKGKSEFTIKEAFEIKAIFFPTIPIEELFARGKSERS